MRARSDLMDRLRKGAVPDVLIIGGGINGAGVFRDLAAQGVASLLVEKGDFSSGTSAAPSRLIHGGLRYLETGETALVRESLVERNLLLKNARHVVHPQPVWIPLRDWFGGSVSAALRFFRLKRTPGRKGAVPVALGLMAYDLFGRTHRTMPTHRMMRASTAREKIPSLPRDLRAVAEFHDARISHPERLVMELLADGETDCPDAMAVPYLSAGAQEGGRVTLHDQLSDETLHVSPRIVVNATGAWVDGVQGGLGIPGKLMGGTRGTHMVMRNPGLAAELDGRMLYFETRDFRACLALPLDARHVYVGTTDIRTDDPDDRRFTDAEIDYIFEVLKPVLPGVDWRRADIVFVMAGVRPLPFQDDKVRSAGAISRDHRIDRFEATADRPFETLTLVGGKWTTYRAFAEQVADAVLAHVAKTRRMGTDRLPIGGARDLPETEEQRTGWLQMIAEETASTPERMAELAARYGGRARAFAEAEKLDRRGFETIEGYTPAEIALICEEERVSRLEDVVLRRTLMAFEGRTSRRELEEVADVVGEALGWDPARRGREVADLAAFLEHQHMVTVR